MVILHIGLTFLHFFQILELTSLRNLFLGGNNISVIPPAIGSLRRLRVFYLGGNRIKRLPAEVSLI
jgi:Leucine-rich repeat (LRR) protein